jgi:hypothetical protein
VTELGTGSFDGNPHYPNTLTADPALDRLEKFNDLLEQWRKFGGTKLGKGFRSAINREKSWVRQQVIEAGCFVTMTIGPPPAVGGLIAQNVDPFGMMFEPPYGVDLIQVVHDMVDQTIGVIRAGPVKEPRRGNPVVQSETEKGYAFVAMPILVGDPENDDVLDAIKEADGADADLDAFSDEHRERPLNRFRCSVADRDPEQRRLENRLALAVDEHHPMSRGEQLAKTIGGDEAADAATEDEYCLVVTHEPAPA